MIITLRRWLGVAAELLAVAVAVVIVGAFALLYLALPAMAAGEKNDIHPIAGGLSILIFFFLWLIVASLAVDAAASIYGFRRPWLATGRWGLRLGRPALQRPGPAITAVACSYFLTLYNFAVVFLAISRRDPLSFRPSLDIGSAAYFSLITAATVGYGDIIPVSGPARLAVATEIVISFAYVAALFSVIAGLAWNRTNDGQSS